MKCAVTALLALSALNLTAAEDEPSHDDEGPGPKYVIVPVSKGVQMGKFPYLQQGGSVNIQPSEQACMDQCESLPDCEYGTFVTQGKLVSDHIHAFDKVFRYGECWLSSVTHSKEVSCGVPCKGFKKVLQKDHEDDPITTPSPNLSQTKECTCETNPDIYLNPEKLVKCLASCKHHGLLKMKKKPCKCDPAKHPSHFTTCQKDPFSFHIRTMHLQPRFHTVPHKGGEQHICKMVQPSDCDDLVAPQEENYHQDENWDGKHCDKLNCETNPIEGESEPHPDCDLKPYEACKAEERDLHKLEYEHKCEEKCMCCECQDDGNLSFSDIVEISMGHHTAQPPFLPTGNGIVVTSKHECMQMCEDHSECRAGTYFTDGTQAGECYLSENMGPEEQCSVDGCESFVKLSNYEREGDIDVPMPEHSCLCGHVHAPVTCANGIEYENQCMANCALSRMTEKLDEDTSCKPTFRLKVAKLED